MKPQGGFDHGGIAGKSAVRIEIGEAFIKMHQGVVKPLWFGPTPQQVMLDGHEVTHCRQVSPYVSEAIKMGRHGG